MFFLTIAGMMLLRWWITKGKVEFLAFAVFSVCGIGRLLLVVSTIMGNITPPSYLVAWDIVVALVAYTALIISTRDSASAAIIMKHKE